MGQVVVDVTWTSPAIRRMDSEFFKGMDCYCNACDLARRNTRESRADGWIVVED